MPNSQVECPICGNGADQLPSRDYGDKSSFNCPHCGPYVLSRTTLSILYTQKETHQDTWLYLPHAIRRMNRETTDPYLIGSDHLKSLLNNPYRPTPREQADNLILELGQRTFDPGQEFEISFYLDGGITGSPTVEAFRYILNYLLKEELLLGTLYLGDQSSVQLSFTGWDRYEELRKGTGTGTTAFMAMQFGNDELDNIVNECLRPAVKETGFHLSRIDDPKNQRAGLIDDRLRVDINTARFMICDLTHNNNGAYWEAGYAEGLGKPIIYTCKQSVFEERAQKGGGTHFDTNHHLHILWDSDNISDASERIKACIRATIPDAKQTD